MPILFSQEQIDSTENHLNSVFIRMRSRLKDLGVQDGGKNHIDNIAATTQRETVGHIKTTMESSAMVLFKCDLTSLLIEDPTDGTKLKVDRKRLEEYLCRIAKARITHFGYLTSDRLLGFGTVILVEMWSIVQQTILMIHGWILMIVTERAEEETELEQLQSLALQSLEDIRFWWIQGRETEEGRWFREMGRQNAWEMHVNAFGGSVE